MMPLYARISIFCIALLGLTATAALAAGPPDANASTVDPCFVTCPLGDFSFQVIVRDATGTVCPGVIVDVDFCNCTGPQLCRSAQGGSCADGTSDVASATTDAAGQVTFRIAAGGACPGALVDISAGGVLLAQRVVQAMDFDNDFTVTAADFTMGGGPGNDYNCDGIVNLSDFVLFTVHQQHFCVGPVHDEQREWGAIKSLYR